MKNLLSLYFVLLPCVFFGQNLNSSAQKIEEIRKKTVYTESNDERNALTDTLVNLLKDFMEMPDSYDYDFKNLEFTGTLRSPDKAFRMITWNTPLPNNTYRYHLFLQFPEGNYFYLYDVSGSGDRPLTKTLSAKDWLGALYYEIIPFKREKQKHYLLLGWDGNNRFTTRKIADVMYFNKNGNPVFGAPVFIDDDEQLMNRLILEFKKDASVSLKYDDKKDRIIFNHLEPLNEEMKGIYRFYVPNLEFDAYNLQRNGDWTFEENVQVIIKTEEIFNDPRTIEEPVEKPGNRKR